MYLGRAGAVHWQTFALHSNSVEEASKMIMTVNCPVFEILDPV